MTRMTRMTSEDYLLGSDVIGESVGGLFGPGSLWHDWFGPKSQGVVTGPPSLRTTPAQRLEQRQRRAVRSTQVVGAAPSIGPYVTIHLADVKALIAQKGGSLGATAQGLLPQSIEKMVYGQVKDKIVDSLQKEGVAADVRIMDVAPGRPISASEFLVGGVAGAGMVGLGWLAVSFFRGRR
jgi:hypothetical protein